MSIDARAARGFGIVKVNGNETIPADHPIEFAQRLSRRSFTADIVTRGEKMRGIEANN